MECRKFILVALLMLAFSACKDQFGNPPGKRPARVTITHSYAGLLVKEPSGNYSYEDLHVIPMREGQAFGWWMRVETERLQIRWREELEFPSPPPASALSAAPGEARMIASDGRTVITESIFYPGNFWLKHSWVMHEGYPAGKYVFNIYLDGEPAGAFNFEAKPY